MSRKKEENVDLESQIETTDLAYYKEKYELARKQFEKDKLVGENGAIELSADLLRDILIEILMINHMFLPNDNRTKESIKIAGTREELETIDLKIICDLFDDQKISLFDSAGGLYAQNSILLSSIKFVNLALFTELVINSGFDSDFIKLGAQQLLNTIIILLHSHKKLQIGEYHLLANFTHMTEEIKNIRNSHSKLEGVISKLSYIKDEREEVAIRPFNWYKTKGMLINEGDGSRNIAFKVETFVNLLTTMFLGITDNNDIKSTHKTKDLTKIAKEIIFTSGYNSGAAFGWTMNEIIQKNDVPLSIAEKIKKWCDFDSDVGFGLLNLHPLDASPEEIEEGFEKHGFSFIKYTIQIKLSDNFVVHKRDSNDTNLCTFVAGYIKGVLEKITGHPMEIGHNPNECQQFSSNDYCLFKINTREDILVNNFLKANEKYSDSNIEQIDSLKINTI